MDNPYLAPAGIAADESTTKESNDPVLAQRGQRLAAVFLDNLIGIGFTLAVLFLYGLFFHNDPFMGGQLMQPTLPNLLVLTAIPLVGWLVINGYMIAHNGQTLGKLALKIKMVRAESDELPSLGRVFFLRLLPVNLVVLIPVVGHLLLIADGLFIFGKERRCLHDRLAGTRVVEARPGP
ncbi:RDD family protein [Alloalcanivorax marinus]|uniref:RDD family protein n=1 Tax=Alloalcanivorax marinus TaxID=1177169 RepID=UPI0019314016|nr:RDD family protein [Alloalcanivorax marinus]MBL7252607.1 RDD family protein [Alloalcanivorax marinus]